MDCGTGPDRLGYGGCAKGLILEENEWFSETFIDRLWHRVLTIFVFLINVFIVKIC